MAHFSRSDNRTTTQRGLGYQHQRRRALLLPAAFGTRCPGPFTGPRSSKCTGLMVDRKLMHLDENPPRALGTPNQWRICCAHCNMSSGARLGHQMQARKLTARNQRPPRAQSRAW